MENNNVLPEAPEDFRLAVGSIVFEFAALEGVASEVITNKYRNSVSNASWSRSGKQFIYELRTCFDADETFTALCDRLDDLGTWRNMYIHSEWLFLDDGRASLMKRKHQKGSSNPVSFEMNSSVRISDLYEYVDKIRALAEGFLPYVTKAWDGRYVQG